MCCGSLLLAVGWILCEADPSEHRNTGDTCNITSAMESLVAWLNDASKGNNILYGLVHFTIIPVLTLLVASVTAKFISLQFL